MTIFAYSNRKHLSFGMKTNKFGPIMTLAMLWTAMMFTSCGDPLSPDNQEVVESKVLDKGLSNKVSTKQLSGTDETGKQISGTELSYESWIKVQTKTAPKTRAGGNDGDVVTVLLKDVFHNTDTTITFNNKFFDIGDYTTDISYRIKGTRQDGYITITDSVMVYSVIYEDFTFEYELEYEVAVYNDGISREIMPYHKIQNLKDNGITIEKLECVHDESLTVFARRQINHSVSVELNGETYTLKGKVILQMPYGSAAEPYVKKSELLSSSYYTSGDQVHSELRLKRWWSDGSVKTETIDLPVYAYIDDHIGNVNFEGQLPDNIELLSSSLGEVNRIVGGSPGYPYTDGYEYYQIFNVSYNILDFGMECYHSGAYYYDGYTKCDFAVPEFKNFRFSEKTIEDGQSGVRDGRKYKSYWLVQYVKADFDKIEFEAPITIGLVVWED